LHLYNFNIISNIISGMSYI